ncbi:MAG: hypothetical protein KC476_11470, partial [Cyanobacteria bacterium HKST-UBA06]|nr:hypothetical protein [Cyanobacteria bacterium HKST-UBA06]
RGMVFDATFRQLASVVGALLGDTQVGDTQVGEINETHEGLKTYQHHLFKFLNTLPVQLRFDNGRLVVAHAAAPEADHGQPTSKRIRRKSLYGFQADTPDEFGLKPRTNWTNTYTGPAVVVYGHVPHQNVYANNNCYDVDTGCCFGNKLTALRYPEMNWVDVAANHIYEAYPRGALPTTWVDPETTA